MLKKYCKILCIVFLCMISVFACEISYAEDDLGIVYLYSNNQENDGDILLSVDNAREFVVEGELFVEAIGEKDCMTKIVAQTDLAELKVGSRVAVGDTYLYNNLLPARGYSTYEEYRKAGIVNAGTIIDITQPGEYIIYTKTLKGDITSTVLYVYAADKDIFKSNVKLVVKGSEYKLESYNIDGSNYIRLSELGDILADTEKSFYYYVNDYQQYEVIVTWYDYHKYNKRAVSVQTVPEKAYKNKWQFYYSDGMFGLLEEYDMTMYFVGNKNFVKLRGIAKLLDIGVQWDSRTNEVVVDISRSYTE